MLPMQYPMSGLVKKTLAYSKRKFTGAKAKELAKGVLSIVGAIFLRSKGYKCC